MALHSKNSAKLRIVEGNSTMFVKRYTPLSALLAIAALLAIVPQSTSAESWGVLTNLFGCEDSPGFGGYSTGESAFVTGRMSAACIPIFIGHLVTFVYGFVGTFFVLNVMYAGYQLAIASIGEGDKGDGKERLKWSILGLIISTCVFLILDLFLYVILGT